MAIRHDPGLLVIGTFLASAAVTATAATSDPTRAVVRGASAIDPVEPHRAGSGSGLYRLVEERYEYLLAFSCSRRGFCPLWTLNRRDLKDVPGLELYDPPAG